MKRLFFSVVIIYLACQFSFAQEKAKTNFNFETNKLSDGDNYDIYLPVKLPKNEKLPLYFIFSYRDEGQMLVEPLQDLVSDSKIGLVHLKNLNSIMSIGKLRAKFTLTVLDIHQKYSFHHQRIYFGGLKSGAIIAMAVAKWSRDAVKGLLLVDGCHIPIEGHPVVISDIYSFGRKEGRGLRTLTNLQKRLKSYDVKFIINKFESEGEVPSKIELSKSFIWFDKEWFRYADDLTSYGRLQRRRIALAEYKKISKLKSKKKFDIIYNKFEIFLEDFGNSSEPTVLSLLKKANKKLNSYATKPDVVALLNYRKVTSLMKDLTKNYENISSTINQLKEISTLYPNTLASQKSIKGISYWETYMKERKIYVKMRSNEEVVKGYLSFIEKEIKNEQNKKLIQKVYLNAQQSKELSEFIPNSMMLIDESYQRGMIAFGLNKMNTAKKYFSNITNEQNNYLQAYREYYLARIHVIKGNYEEAEIKLEMLLKGNVKFTTHKEDIFFLLAISLFKQFKRNEAEALFNEFMKRFPDAPERMVVGASQMVNRIRAYEEGSLSDVEERMDYSKRKIRLSDMGEDSIKNQKKIVEILAKLIKEAEQQEQDQRDRNRQNQSGNGQSPSNPSQPAEESSAPEGKTKIGDLKKFSRGKRSEMWGKARKKEREKVLNNLKEKFPERYRQLIEQYFKGLQKDEE
ncbi:MAG: hypothetical protein COA79_13580 [Planctomycetota bacterium]|nr:MAG: hypothetical protein COA79_13580 [Planctomycetota bacterium]